MRTREEQINSLADTLAWPSHPDDWHKGDATDIILEAERRAEERVRAEIGRDSERLDWLTSLQQYVLEHDSIGEWTVWKFTGPNEPAINMGDSVYSMRDAIDRARLFGPINTTELDTRHD